MCRYPVQYLYEITSLLSFFLYEITSLFKFPFCMKYPPFLDYNQELQLLPHSC